jgi:hypothetical protein
LSVPRPIFRTLHHPSTLLLCLCICGLFHTAQAQTQPSTTPTQPQQPSVQPARGAITSFVTDQDGDAIPNATITLSHPAQSPTGSTPDQNTPESTNESQTTSGSDGSFSFTSVEAGSLQLTFIAPGFTTRQTTLSLQPGEHADFPAISLLAAANINVEVTASQQDIAQEQVAIAEKQRVFGVIPNFYVSYDANPAPLAPKQKFQMAWKMSVDPVNFAVTGIIAGVEQSQNTFAGYGQGAQGYAKRYGAAYADGFIGTMISNAILPTVFKQDPRYFYKGTGTVTARALYAIANSVICKGDNGRWQPNYSNILGNFAAGGISNLYYPAANRDGVKLTVEDTLLGLAAASGANLFQEFLIRKITPHAHHPISISSISTSPSASTHP